MEHRKQLTKSDLRQHYLKAEQVVDDGLDRMTKGLPQVEKVESTPEYRKKIADAIEGALASLENVHVIPRESEKSAIKAMLGRSHMAAAKSAAALVSVDINDPKDDYTELFSHNPLEKAWRDVRSTADIVHVSLCYLDNHAHQLLAKCTIPVWRGAIQPIADEVKVPFHDFVVAYSVDLQQSYRGINLDIETCPDLPERPSDEAVHAGKKESGLIFVSHPNGKAETKHVKQLIESILHADTGEVFFAYEGKYLVKIAVPGLFSSNRTFQRHHGRGLLAGISCSQWGEAWDEQLIPQKPAHSTTKLDLDEAGALDVHRKETPKTRKPR